MTQAGVKRNYKDSLFRLIFQEKSELLSLYNAMNHSDYRDPELLEITTMQDVIYMSIKNDTSFLLDEYMNLYEAQSTWNPNMPLRGLFYFSGLYRGYVEENQMDIYSKTKLMLPTPKYVVLYNGTAKKPDLLELKLSDSYIRPSSGETLECRAVVYNINWGHNQELMKNCRKLYEYAYLVDRVRRYIKEGLILAAAVDRALEDCLEEGILKAFLLKHRAEVKLLILEEYNEERHIKNERELAREEGVAEGLAEGLERGIEQGKERNLIDLVCKKLKKGKRPELIAEELEEECGLISRICQAAGLTAPDYDCDVIYQELHKGDSFNNTQKCASHSSGCGQ